MLKMVSSIRTTTYHYHTVTTTIMQKMRRNGQHKQWHKIYKWNKNQANVHSQSTADSTTNQLITSTQYNAAAITTVDTTATNTWMVNSTHTEWFNYQQNIRAFKPLIMENMQLTSNEMKYTNENEQKTVTMQQVFPFKHWGTDYHNTVK